MKGIILAGGTGSRLYPITQGVSKQLIPVYDKPMIYYPLSILMLASIRDIAIISTQQDQPAFQRLLGDGSAFGIKLSYFIQDSPDGLAQAFTICEEFIDHEPTALILGDNVFWGHSFSAQLQAVAKDNQGATVFGYRVLDPENFGVVEFDDEGKALSLQEKPKDPKSNWAITGLYFYDGNVAEMAKDVKLSARGEYEITELNQLYMDLGKLKVEKLGRGFAWLDMGTHDNLLTASQFIQTIEKRQGFKIACLQEIAYYHNWICQDELFEQAKIMAKTQYGQYLYEVATSGSVENRF